MNSEDLGEMTDNAWNEAGIGLIFYLFKILGFYQFFV